MRILISAIALLLAAYITPMAAQVVDATPVRTMRTTKAEVISFAISPKGDRLLVGLNKGAELYDLESGKRIHALPFNEDGGTAVYHVGFNENGEYLVLIGHSGKRVVFDVKKAEKIPITTSMRWVPDPRAVKAMGLDMKNSNFDRFYQQAELSLEGATAKAGKHGLVEFVDAEGKVLQKLEFPENKDQHHRAPLLLLDGTLLVGTDDGRVLFYTVR
ncbi:MAG: hypothetical protein KF905_03325 [Flavobacteriales bacterium]|nr:hypothetical protein [Flavobacteriales bacterium]